MKNEKFDIYKMITDKILSDIQNNGKLTWVKEWKTKRGLLPMNAVSKKPYEGINLFLLSLSHYSSPYYLSFKQVEELGGNVKKGEKATQVVFWKLNQYTKQNEQGETETKNVPLLRYYNVFNLEQCENVTIKEKPAPEITYNENEIIENAENLIAEYITREKINTRIIEQDRAFYRPSTDEITMPLFSQFSSGNAFYSTYFHEIGHSTGHEKRLNRKEVVGTINFGSCDYGTEELVAELTAAFLCAETGINNETTERNNSAYIKNWYNAIKADPKMFVMASARANKATKFVLNKKQTEEQE
jgi:antirestriction protein ArdC